MRQDTILICTATGDDPCAPVSGFLLETKAESIIAGIQKRITETGATRAYIYIPEQYTKVVKKITGLAGDIEIKTGQDSLVCRDKTALVAALNGGYIRPFYVESEKDLLFDNNFITEIITIEDAVNYGENEFNKTFYIYGAIENSCFVRFPWGTPLQTIIDAAGGGVKKDKKIKAILLGGMLGKWVKPEDIKSVVTEKETLVFSGGIEIFDQSICIADITRTIINNCRIVSCGKCPLCREGTYQLFSAFNDITNGKGKVETLMIVKEMAANIAFGAFCQFGKNMAEFVNSALDVFGSEIEDHIRRKKCPASICKAFMNLIVLPDKCTGCGKCLDVCDDDAIEGKKGYIHMIQDNDCVKCGKCIEVCEVEAVVTVSDVKPRLPKRLTKVGQFS